MRALFLTVLSAMPAQADTVGSCPYRKNNGLLNCEDIETAKQALLGASLPATVQGTEIQQYLNQLYFQVTLDGVPTGNEGNQVETVICGFPEWRELLDREYTMSVRMTHRQGDFIRLEEIAFIEDCEAN